MTIQEIIDYVDAMKPSAFTPEQKVIWLNEVEGMAQLDVMELAQSDVIQYLYPDDKDHEPLVPPPHQKIYYTYMLAMIDFANGEYNKYQNTMALFNMSFMNYTRWFADHYRPADSRCEERGYYISAYSIAVKHGYAGTEEQWLASLKGDQAVSTQEAIAAAQAAATSQANATASAVTAGNSAAMATDKAGVAVSHAGAAGNSAATAVTKASEAATSAVTAGNSAAAAASSASSAATKAGEASAAAQTAVSAKTAAEIARDQAEAAALVQYDDVPTAGSLHPVRSNGIYNALADKADLISGKIPEAQLPSYVDDVIEAAAIASLPTIGEAGKIYVTTNDNKTWRWSGSAYVEISASLALGETAATSYRGDRGAVAYTHSQLMGNPHNTTRDDIGLGNVDNTSDANKPISIATQTALDAKQDKITNALNRLLYGSGVSGALSQLVLPATSGSVLRQDTSGAPYWTTLSALVAAMKASLVDTVYPVGSIYMSVSSTSPATLFGGTWTSIKGRFLIGTGVNDANTTGDWGALAAGAFNCFAGDLGGELRHVLTEGELPAISGTINFHGAGSATVMSGRSGNMQGLTARSSFRSGGDAVSGTTSYDGATFSFGSGNAHNNMPPYLAVYMWKRTA